MTISKIKAALFAALFVAIGVVLASGAAMAYQGHMFNARAHLNRALNQLNAGIPDKGIAGDLKEHRNETSAGFERVERRLGNIETRAEGAETEVRDLKGGALAVGAALVAAA